MSRKLRAGVPAYTPATSGTDNVSTESCHDGKAHPNTVEAKHREEEE